jgi:hypothetical protein
MARVAWELPRLVVRSQKFVLPSSLSGLIVRTKLIFVTTWED